MKLLLVGGFHHGKVVDLECGFPSIRLPRVPTSSWGSIQELIVDTYIKITGVEYTYYVPEMHNPQEINRLLQTLNPRLLDVDINLAHLERISLDELNSHQSPPFKIKDITSLMEDSADKDPDDMLERILAKGRRHLRVK